MKKGLYTNLELDFTHTSFDLLMQKRIHRVLLICSNYDAFMLEEDGRIDEQIFNEYVSLSLRYPPVIIMANSANEAFQVLQNENIDLVIEMLNIGDVDPFNLANNVRSKYKEIPIVVLTHFSREVSLRLQNEDLSSIDYVFSWLGNADLLVAIIKLIEDRMNAEFDVESVGVQTIILVEDSVRFISMYLPSIYKIIFTQSREFMKEALNEHQKMLRMRGRPKILLAKTYEEAMGLYQKYKRNMLGIISDVSFKKVNVRDHESKMGLELCKKIKEDDPHNPVLLQSSDRSNEQFANKIGAGFLHKHSKNLMFELKEYIIQYFAFGKFIFYDPETNKEIARAEDLQQLQQLILKIPDRVLRYHASRNDLSKWLNARALFPIAQLFKTLGLEDFQDLDEARKYIYDAISSFRISKGRGIIALFDRLNYDEYTSFARIGDGSLGGKARGLAFINTVIRNHKIFRKFDNVIITIPRTVVITTDIFDEFIEMNSLFELGWAGMTDDEILYRFIHSKMPAHVVEDLKAYLRVAKNPIAIRSSSKLEDSYYQPFAGVYSTYMVPIIEDDLETSLQLLCDSIKCVYASVYFKSSRAYMTATSNVIDEEKMGVILQEVCGQQYGTRFYPAISGVARSINFYPIPPEKATDGIVTIAYGLGKYIVDGGRAIRFSPKYPAKVLQLSIPELALKDTQKQFFALDLTPKSFIPSVDDSINLLRLPVREATKDPVFNKVTSVYDYESHMLRDGTHAEGKKIITFSSILKYKTFPLAEIMQTLLDVGQKEMNNPIEIEFAVNLDVPKGEPVQFYFLQIRPIVLNDQSISFTLDDIAPGNTIITSDSVLGNGIMDAIHDIIYIVPEKFKARDSESLAKELEKLNDYFLNAGKNYILIGPGRWGSSDPWLGVPVKWPQISGARVIVESGLENYRIDPSQGTHFFQNLTSFGVGYFTVNPYKNDGFYDNEFLNGHEAVYESNAIRHVRFEKSIVTKIDGKNNKGVIMKPGME